MHMGFPLKPPKTFHEQLEILKSRGMIIENDMEAIHRLETCNYYRISGYSYQFKINAGSNSYKPGTKFANVIRLYDYDEQLRTLIGRCLETIEIFVRTQIAYHFSHEYGAYGHYNYINYKTYEAYEQFEKCLSSAIDKNCDIPFVKNHVQKYSTQHVDPKDGKVVKIFNMPLWAAVEILSFSTISKFYANISSKVKRQIANSMCSDVSRLEQWLWCLANLRNLCAHFGRIYNNDLHPSITYENALYAVFANTPLQTNRLFGYLIAILRLLPSNNQRRQLLHNIETLNDEYEDILDYGCIGFPQDWRSYFCQWTVSNP